MQNPFAVVSLALIALASLTICSAKAQLEAGERIVTEAEALNALGQPAPNLYVSPESNFVATNQSGHRNSLPLRSPDSR
jgi:hypothetical protein